MKVVSVSIFGLIRLWPRRVKTATKARRQLGSAVRARQIELRRLEGSR